MFYKYKAVINLIKMKTMRKKTSYLKNLNKKSKNKLIKILKRNLFTKILIMIKDVVCFAVIKKINK